MRSCIVSVLLLISAVEGSDRFFISAPNVFHVGVKEKVFVQMGSHYRSHSLTLYLEIENSQKLVSATQSIHCIKGGEIKTVELMIDRELWKSTNQPFYLNLVAQVTPPKNRGTPCYTDGEQLPNPDKQTASRNRKITRVLVSNHRGYIFIQTDQPMYNPSQKVRYRIFTLDHMFRPHEETVYISVFNADGNRIKRSLKAIVGGLYKDHFPIPSVSKTGTWKITAHYEGDEAKAAVREFKVQKFVLPSFDVHIEMERRYLLLSDEQLDFTISAMYSYGEKVKGAYHCRFGVLEKGAARGQQTPIFIRELELTGSVQNGSAALSLQFEKINLKLEGQMNRTLPDLQRSGSQLYVGVFVTNIENGEVQEGEVYLPVLSQQYNMDLSRTRSHYLPGYPLDVVAVMSLPDGAPAAYVPITITVGTSPSDSWRGATDQDGIAAPVFNIPGSTSAITVEVSADGLNKRKSITPVSSPSGSHLYISITNKVYSVKDTLTVTFSTVNSPNNGDIYYMVLSRGIIVDTGSLRLGTAVKYKLPITADMVPAFRLIGYYYSANGDIIADSVWVDVRDECELKVKVEHKGNPVPGKPVALDLDLHGQSAKVALLAVDKAFYALKADNKLTAKQVFSSMTSYDLGCTYGGGQNSSKVLMDAGLSFVSQSTTDWRKNLGCDSHATRQGRSLDLRQEITSNLKYDDPDLQECCTNALSLIPMRRTCEERAARVGLVKSNQTCVDVFLKCCKEQEKLRKKKMLMDAQNQLGRTSSASIIEEFFLENSDQYIRRYFPPSFAFTEFDVNDKKTYSLLLPDSITTWEVQVITLSPSTGFCVVKPHEVKAFKKAFVSLRLPYSVKKYEQLSVSPVIYNYGDQDLKLAVNMEQTEGLCSPASATKSTYVQIDVKPQSSQFVSFSAVPMVTGSIPIKIRLYDVENDWGIDALEKSLNVQTEGYEQRLEETKVVKFDGRSSATLYIDGTLPDESIPDTSANIFVSVEGEGFGSSHARSLLSPEKVASLITLPYGCLEQTTNRLAPTVLALRYLDLSDQWFDLPSNTRDQAMANVERGYLGVLSYKKKGSKSYGSFYTVSSSLWATAYIVKVLSLVGERQAANKNIDLALEEDLIQSVSYLCSIQRSDGSFADLNQVIHRDVRKDQGAWLTAFVTLALKRCLPFLTAEGRTEAEATIREATTYLQSQLPELSHTYALALTTYCLSACLTEEADRLSAWRKLQSRAIKDENNCYLWTEDPRTVTQNRVDAITIETTAYALLAAVELQDNQWADQIACWLISQENYNGGYKSTQDTVVALEALSEYELKKSRPGENTLTAEFTVSGKSELITLTVENKKEKVETDLKKLTGHKIKAQLTGTGSFKVKTVKAFHVLDPEDRCAQLSISVTVEGKVKYTDKIIDNYDYYEDYVTEEKQTRKRRDVDSDLNSDNIVTYTVCVSQNSSLSGMAIADITLLSGFVAEPEDLERLKMPPEVYISHYELTSGRVLIYFNQLLEQQECISFDAKQLVPVGLLQPAPAVFYDYYEPDRKCTVFYSAPKRSRMISKLCSDEVCQCAERPCHTMRETFKPPRGRRITKAMRAEHACFYPTVDYAFIVEVQSVSVKSNFQLYKVKITEVLRFYADLDVKENSVRVFAKRLQCKGELELGRLYLIMGKDGSTKDSSGKMQYLLESNTWVEKRPLGHECSKSANRVACVQFDDFVEDYKINGCTQ